MEKTLRSKRLAPTGWQDRNWHQQVLEMCNRQLQQKNYGHYLGRSDTTRLEIALSIAAGFNRHKKVVDHISQHERQWIMKGTIPLSTQGKHAKTLCMVEDPGTREAMMEFIHGAGKNACALGLSKAVTAYWQASVLPELEEKELAASAKKGFQLGIMGPGR
jgi:NOL1/NOP2/fmu family ribosome biogenesis protein